MDNKLLDILACPICKGPLKLSADKTELISKGAGLAYPIRDGIPVMLENEARTISLEEKEKRLEEKEKHQAAAKSTH